VGVGSARKATGHERVITLPDMENGKVWDVDVCAPLFSFFFFLAAYFRFSYVDGKKVGILYFVIVSADLRISLSKIHWNEVGQKRNSLGGMIMWSTSPD
jgi:hypothetical protein